MTQCYGKPLGQHFPARGANFLRFLQLPSMNFPPPSQLALASLLTSQPYYLDFVGAGHALTTSICRPAHRPYATSTWSWAQTCQAS